MDTLRPFLSVQKMTKNVLVFLAVACGNKRFTDHSPQHFRARPAEYSLRLRVPIYDAPCRVHFHKRIESEVYHPPRSLFGFARRRAGWLAVHSFRHPALPSVHPARDQRRIVREFRAQQTKLAGFFTNSALDRVRASNSFVRGNSL